MKGEKIVLVVAVVLVLSLAFSGLSRGQVKRLSVATTVAGGPWYLLGGAWAKLVNTKVPGVDLSVETGGTIPNVQSLQKRRWILGCPTRKLPMKAIWVRDGPKG